MLAIDCKYKRLAIGEFKHHDQYQMLAYCTALPVNSGLLVYPRHETEVVGGYRVRNSVVRVHQMTIDLGVPRHLFADACRDVAVAVTRMATTASPADSS